MLEPFTYLHQLPGNQVRIKFIYALNSWYGIPTDKLTYFKKQLDNFFTACLLQDDIEDASDFRRGYPAAHLIYGVRSVFSASRYAMLQTYREMLMSSGLKIVQTVLSYVLQTHRGQEKDIYWRDNFICPTVEEYKQMAYNTIADIMGVYSESKVDIVEFVRPFILFLQIRDDYVDLYPDENATTKTSSGDISEGKFGFPVVHAVQTRPDDKRIINILKQKTNSMEVIKHCLSLLKELGSLDFTYNLLKEMKDELLKELKKLPENPSFVNLLENDLKLLQPERYHNY